MRTVAAVALLATVLLPGCTSGADVLPVGWDQGHKLEGPATHYVPSTRLAQAVLFPDQAGLASPHAMPDTCQVYRGGAALPQDDCEVHEGESFSESGSIEGAPWTVVATLEMEDASPDFETRVVAFDVEGRPAYWRSMEKFPADVMG